MVKVVARNRAGSYQRLVVMTEKEYEELRAALLQQNKKTGPGNPLVEKYLGDDAHPELSMSERLSLYNQAVAREEATRQFTDERYSTSTSTNSTTTTNSSTKPQQQLQLVDTIRAAEEEPTSSTADVKNDEAAGIEEQEQDTKDAKADELSTSLPNVRVPILHGPRLSALKTVLESSGTVSVDKLGRVYINRTLLDDKSNYFDLMRSLFVHSKKDANLAGRARFLEHLHKLGVSAKQVSTRSAKVQLQHLDLQPKQAGGKTQRKTLGKCSKGSCPPGKRPKVLLMYR